ncbi:MAG TPA: hypothetical protein VIY96_02370 [Thermoanaerobaculia bacterium]
METTQKGPQRTGWVILVLMVVSNFMAWMEPVVSVTAGYDAIAPMQLKMSLGACILAAALVTATWLTGRHSSSSIPGVLRPPRMLGFRLALAAAAANIAFGIAIASLGPYASIGAYRLSVAIQAAWFVVVLPAEVISAYLTGRGTVRRNEPAPQTV